MTRKYEIVHAKVEDYLRDFDGPLFHAVLTDPPYGLAFMGKSWDAFKSSLKAYQIFTKEWSSLLLKVLHDGTLMLSFGGTRTFHRLACGFEDGGWQIWDSIARFWLHGTGFTKGQDVGKLIDKMHGAERDIETRIWNGYKTPALKPAWEPIICARAPRHGKTYARLATSSGAGCLNVDGCRIGTDIIEGGRGGRDIEPHKISHRGRYPANLMLECTCKKVITGKVIGNGHVPRLSGGAGGKGIYGKYDPIENKERYLKERGTIHTDPECPCHILDAQSGILKSGMMRAGTISKGQRNIYGDETKNGYQKEFDTYGDKGGASRFFYCPKANPKERDLGLLGLFRCVKCGELDTTTHIETRPSGEKVTKKCIRNDHPTVKPIEVNRWLGTLLLPPKEIEERRLLVPFCGTGSEMIGAFKAGWDTVIGVEMDEDYVKIAEARLRHYFP